MTMEEKRLRKTCRQSIRSLTLMELQQINGSLMENGRLITTQQDALEIDVQLEEIRKAIDKRWSKRCPYKIGKCGKCEILTQTILSGEICQDEVDTCNIFKIIKSHQGKNGELKVSDKCSGCFMGCPEK